MSCITYISKIYKIYKPKSISLFLGGVGACHGDEGSPLVIDGVLVGMVQRVPIICDNSDPTVYIRMSKYIDWIHDII